MMMMIIIIIIYYIKYIDKLYIIYTNKMNYVSSMYIYIYTFKIYIYIYIYIRTLSVQTVLITSLLAENTVPLNYKNKSVNSV